MGKFHWDEVTHADVVKAIAIFDAENPVYPEPRSTYLIYDGKKYPAKHIRGMAYKVHFGSDISKEDYAGGQETVRFFERLGFEMRYTHQAVNTHPIKKPPVKPSENTKKNEPPTTTEKLPVPSIDAQKIAIPVKGVIEQKNALQLLLNKMFDGDVVCEKTYPWMKTPSEITGEYIPLVKSLSAYRGDKNFAKKNITLRCDFVCENSKLMIEYDERQHFSEARRISLMSYTSTPLCYDRNLWIAACKDIQAKDNQPANRDEVRAFYDSTRDIEAAKHGYKLVRIMHGQIDFQAADAFQKLAELLNIPGDGIPQADAVAPAESGRHADEAVPQKSLKIGLYLQTYELAGNVRIFEEAMNAVRASDVDILVFPEISYVPFVEDFYKADFCADADIQSLFDKTLELSRSIGRAVVISNEDKYGTIMCIYANDLAQGDETLCKNYIKHTATNFSACEIANYREIAEDLFEPILYKGHHIGLTICYDCNHSIFGRKYGKNGVDVILNCTGGNVVYDKWFKYNKVRAIENHCFTFVTMAGDGTAPNPHNYVFGFTPTGKEMTPTLLNGVYKGDRNVSGGIYVYDTSEDDGSAEVDPSVDQAESINKVSDLYIPVDDIAGFLHKARPLTDNIRILRHGGANVVLCFVDASDILLPEKVLKLLYADALKEIINKRYIIINRWDKVDTHFYETTLSVVLKVRAMENYCAVILDSSNLTKCYQCGQNRTAQVVKAEDGQFGIDLKRTGGPETIWRNKVGMKACWRDNIEWLIGTL